MVKLFFDIETIPCIEDLREAQIEILKSKKGYEDHDDETLHELSSLEGTFGQICCIGIIKEGPQGVIQKDVFSGTEKDMLTKFWQTAQGVWRFVGHNIWAFDLPFIYKRSIINGIKPLQLPFARYRNVPIYDTMMEWELWNMQSKQKLDTLAKVLKLPTSKDEMNGSMVAKYFKDGRIEEIKKYCMKDVELTRKVYYKMTFEEMPPEK